VHWLWELCYNLPFKRYPTSEKRKRKGSSKELYVSYAKDYDEEKRHMGKFETNWKEDIRDANLKKFTGSSSFHFNSQISFFWVSESDLTHFRIF
jgi:hypothetical protein